VTRFTPPTFLALSSDDRTVPAENSLRYYNKLIDCNVPAEMHIYPTGGHGWGFSAEKYVGEGKDILSYARNEFEASLERWLEAIRKN
jgi:acetyl esterase/lipase